MSRNRRPTPTITPPVQPEQPAKPELMGVRHLGLEHVGRWIQINAVPVTLDDKTYPTVNVQVGRLVGIRKGEYSHNGQRHNPPTRRLVLQQGSTIAELALGVDHPVEVAPRAWS